MTEPAYFPAALPGFRPEVQCYRGLFVSSGGPWQPVTHRPGHHVYRAHWPEHLRQYDALQEYPELRRGTVSDAPPWYWAGLWFLNRLGLWELARSWTSFGACRDGCPRDVGACCPECFAVQSMARR